MADRANPYPEMVREGETGAIPLPSPQACVKNQGERTANLPSHILYPTPVPTHELGMWIVSELPDIIEVSDTLTDKIQPPNTRTWENKGLADRLCKPLYSSIAYNSVENSFRGAN